MWGYGLSKQLKHSADLEYTLDHEVIAYRKLKTIVTTQQRL